MDGIISWQQQKDLINRIRYCFAQISLGMLNPDLVIMDEFQRFKDLIEIDENDYSDSAMLSKKFLKDNTDSCVLLLSATPYKPFSTLSEFTDGEETHIKGFMRVMDFLVNGENENARFHKVWDSYTEHLPEIKGNNLSVLIASKDEAETELYNHMCRTERRDAGIINTDKARAMSIDNLSPANISSYIELQTIMHDLSIGNFPIDYVKSAPYLMSFMNYKVKEKIDNKLRDEKQQISIADRARYIKRMQVAFLKRTQINGYQQLPNTNARLNTLFNEVFRPTEKKKMSPELLLWIPPANKYYECGPQNIFEQCDGYSKTLVFSSWEMVPRVIATLTSYEAERLVNNRIGNKSIEQQSYYAVPESDEMNDDDNPKKNKRGKTRFLIREQRKLVDYPSIWLAGLYDGKKYYGQSISAIKKEIKAVIKDVMRRIASEHNLSQGNMGAKQLLSLLDYMDDSILEYENAEIPERVPSDDDIDTLVNIAIGSPAVCLYRNLKEIVDLEERKKLPENVVTKVLLVCLTDRNPEVLWMQCLKAKKDPVMKNTMNRYFIIVLMGTSSLCLMNTNLL